MQRRSSPVCRTHPARILLMLGCLAGLSALGGCPPMNTPPDDGDDSSGMTGDTGSGNGDASGGGSDFTGGDAVGGATTGGNDGGTTGSGDSGDGGNDAGTFGDGGNGDDNLPPDDPPPDDPPPDDPPPDDPPPDDPPPDDPPPDDPTPGPEPTRIELELIARTGGAVPGQTGDFVVFSNPIIDREGRVAFWGSYNGGTGDAGLYVYQNGALERVVDDNPDNSGEVPGGDNGDYFGDFEITADGDVPGFSWGIGDRLIFSAETRGPSRTNGIFRWRASDGAMVRVIDMIQMEAEFPDSRGPQGFLASFFSPYVTDNAVVVFHISYLFVTQDNNFVRGTGIFASNGVETLPVIDSQLSQVGDVPGQGPNALFTSFPEVFTLSPSGDVLLQASYAGGSGDRGVYLYGSNGLLRAVDNSGDAFPGLPSGATVGSAGEDFDALGIGAGGHIVIDTTLTVGGQPHDTVLIWNGTQWSELSSDDGVPADVLLSGVNASGQCLVLADNRPHLVDADGNSRDLSAVLPAELEGRDIIWQPTGGTINDAGRCLVPYVSVVNGNQTLPGLALWTGEQLLVVVDAALEIPIASISEVHTPARPESDYVDRSGAFNSRDEIVFRVIESGTGEVQSIYVARGLR